MVQVVTNLLSNAIKLLPDGSVIKLDVQDGSDVVRVAVHDSGKGIAEEQFGRFFEKFEQAENTDDIQFQGTELGLAICKAIVEQHGGKIGVESVPGGGAFWFTIPKLQSENCIG